MSAGAPEGFRLDNEVLSMAAWEVLERWLKTDRLCMHDGSIEEVTPIPWEMGAQNRRVAQFGFRYDYEKSVVDTETDTPPIPSLLANLLLDPCDSVCGSDVQFTQCIINDYTEADTIIPWHKDHEDFGPIVLVYTFGDERPLNFRWDPLDNDAQNKDRTYTANPRHGSRYILSGPARYRWEHSVPEGKDRRVSFTFRTHKSQKIKSVDGS